MDVITWIQNNNQFEEDFLFVNCEKIGTEKNERYILIDKILEQKKKGEKIFSEPFLMIAKNFKENKVFVDIKTNDVDEYGRKGVVMILVEGYDESINYAEFTEVLNYIFAETRKQVPNEIVESIKLQLKKKKSNKISKLRIITIFLFIVIVFILIISKINTQNELETNRAVPKTDSVLHK